MQTYEESSTDSVSAVGSVDEARIDLSGLSEGDIRILVEFFRQEPDFCKILKKIKPQSLRDLVKNQVWCHRGEAVKKFASMFVEAEKHNERDWEEFFKENRWIFGGGLSLQFLDEVQEQPSYGGTTLVGTGTQRGDHLMASLANIKFAALVEIKTPATPLVDVRQYRNGVQHLSKDLTGAVSQLQANCHTWVTDGSRAPRNVKALEAKKSTYTFSPRCILVIGSTVTLDTDDKISTFQLFRRNLHNFDVITFDELLARATALLGEGCS